MAKKKLKNKKASDGEFLVPAPVNFKWPLCPVAEEFIEDVLHLFLGKHRFANQLAERMRAETSTRFSAWVDHVRLPAADINPSNLKRLDFWEDRRARRPSGTAVYFHPYADLPKIILSSQKKEIGAAIMVEDIWRFQLAHGLSLDIDGAPYSTYRSIHLPEDSSELLVVERRGSQDFVSDPRPRTEAYIRAFERWTARPRRFSSSAQGMKETLRLARELVRELGTGPAATIFLEGERIYWESRNRAGQVQKARQDALGLGWGNHDHHTFRSSRSNFPALVDILLTFGFKKRERYFAGEQAGWGAQIMEQPEAGTVIFADVDLAPEDVTVDFSKVSLLDLKKPRTVGLWCALHGESILEAGMHHLEAKFDFVNLREDLKKLHIDTMPPFSDFPFLRQAFTKAEMWQVSPERLNALGASGALSEEAARQIKTNGAVGSHLENLQRRDGFKGFNQKGVSDIITAVNPATQALAKPHPFGGA